MEKRPERRRSGKADRAIRTRLEAGRGVPRRFWAKTESTNWGLLRDTFAGGEGRRRRGSDEVKKRRKMAIGERENGRENDKEKNKTKWVFFL